MSLAEAFTAGALFVGVAIGVGAVSLGGPLHRAMPALQAAWALASLAWIGTLLLRRPPRVAILVAGALLLRVLAWIGDPGLSDDVYRYVWEGGLVAEGVSPYHLAPNAPELAEYRHAWPEIAAGVNHPDVRAAYPPLAQALHAAVVAVAGGPARAEASMTAMRLVHGVLELACLLPLALLARPGSQRRRALVFWGWSPLLALEFAGSAHFDASAVLLLLSGLVVLVRGGPRVAATLLFVAGGLVKLLPLLLVPFAARGRRALLHGLLAAVVFAAAWVPFLLWSPFLGEGVRSLWSGLGEYGTRWEAGSLVYRWIETPLALFLERDGTLLDPRLLGRGMVLVIVLAVGLREWRRERRDPVRTAGVLVGTLLVLSPTLHPWYLVWMAPFAALSGSRAWALLFALAPLLYWPLVAWHTEGRWEEPAWLWPVVALPFLAALVFEHRRRGAGPDGSEDA